MFTPDKSIVFPLVIVRSVPLIDNVCGAHPDNELKSTDTLDPFSISIVNVLPLNVAPVKSWLSVHNNALKSADAVHPFSNVIVNIFPLNTADWSCWLSVFT